MGASTRDAASLHVPTPHLQIIASNTSYLRPIENVEDQLNVGDQYRQFEVRLLFALRYTRGL